jgi:hypothetical protein
MRVIAWSDYDFPEAHWSKSENYVEVSIDDRL